ncbi:MAG: PD-(D/E)XK nuclease family protein [Alphaproteobacteria bacterium]
MPLFTIPSSAAFIPTAAAWLATTYPTPASRTNLSLWLPTTRAHQPMLNALAGFGWKRLPTCHTFAINEPTALKLGVHDDGLSIAPEPALLTHLATLWHSRKNTSAADAMAHATAFLGLHNRLTRTHRTWSDVRTSTPPDMAEHWALYADDVVWMGAQLDAYLAHTRQRTATQASVAWLQNLTTRISTHAFGPCVALGFTDATPDAITLLATMAQSPHHHVLIPATPLGFNLAEKLGCHATPLAAPNAPTPTLHTLFTSTPLDEARALTHEVHKALSEGRTPIALVAANRDVARHLHATLNASGIIPHDSAGIPLPETPAGHLWRTVFRAMLNPTPTNLAALTSHALVQPFPTWSTAAGALETCLWRGHPTPPTTTWRAWHTAWRNAPFHMDKHIRTLVPTAQPAWDVLSPLIKALPTTPQPMAVWVQHLTHIIATLAPTATTIQGAEYVSLWLSQLTNLPTPLSPAMALALLETTSTSTTTPQPAYMANIHLWGAQEARLQTIGTLLVAGCNADVWPPKVDDMWLSQAQLAHLGLATNAHRAMVGKEDWESLLHTSPHIVFSRSTTQGGQPTTPSPLLIHLQQTTPNITSLSPPTFPTTSSTHTPATLTPPQTLYPTRWSASLVEAARTCPYQALLSRVLQLHPLPTFITRPGPRELGLLLHSWMETLTHLPTLQHNQPDMVENHLLTQGNKLLNSLPEALARIWQTRLPRLAHAVAHQLAEDARNGWHMTAMETTSERQLDNITLTARIDMLQSNGTAHRVVDFKTGSPPKTPQLTTGAKPQLPLAGWLVEATTSPTTHAAFWHLKGVGPTPLQAQTYHGASWQNLQQAVPQGVADTLAYLAPTAPWPAWPQTGKRTPCTHCPFAGVCQHYEATAT